MDEMTGHCLCGETKFTASGEPSAAHACHCVDCRRFTGSSFIGVDFEALNIAGPVRWFASSEWGERGSCELCGSAMFWRLRSGSGSKVVSLGSLDEPDRIAPIEKHYFDDERPKGFDLVSNGKRLSREETIALFDAVSGST